jgi:hypothetical protein
VKVHYTGWTTDGKMFDSSVTRGQPITFPLDSVIPGWTDGLQVMVVGEKTRFWIPEELAYKGKPGRPQGMLVFDVELIEIDPKDRRVNDRTGATGVVPVAAEVLPAAVLEAFGSRPTRASASSAASSTGPSWRATRRAGSARWCSACTRSSPPR